MDEDQQIADLKQQLAARDQQLEMLRQRNLILVAEAEAMNRATQALEACLIGSNFDIAVKANKCDFFRSNACKSPYSVTRAAAGGPENSQGEIIVYAQ